MRSNPINPRLIMWWPMWLLLVVASILFAFGMSSTKLGHTVVKENVACNITEIYVNSNPGISIKLNCDGTQVSVPRTQQVLDLLMRAPDQRVGIICDKIYADSSVDNCSIPKVEENK